MFLDPEYLPPPHRIAEPWRKILLDAADLIDERGHCQHALERDGKFCMGGAILVAGSASAGATSEATCQLNRFFGGSFVTWNNAYGRTKEEAVAALRAAAHI